MIVLVTRDIWKILPVNHIVEQPGEHDEKSRTVYIRDKKLGREAIC